MSLWTPGGEHPVDRNKGASDPSGPPPSAPQDQPGLGGPGGPGGPGGQTMSPDQQAEAEQVAAEMAQVREQQAQVPAAVVVANHAMGCYELAAIHLSSQPPRLEEAQLAIDAFGALLGAVKGRLGQDEATLDDALAQIRMAFVQVKASVEGSPGEAPAGPDADV